MEPSLKLQVLKTGMLICALIIVPVIGKLIGFHILIPVIYGFFLLFLSDSHIHQQVCSYLVRNVTVWILCRGAIIKCGNWRQALPGRCQETSGHGRKPDEPHNFGAQELMERVHASSITGHKRMPAETPEELMERVHVSSTGIHDQRKRSTLHKRFCVRLSSQRQQRQGHISNPELSMPIFGLPRRPDLDVSQRCNDNVRWSPTVNFCCDHVCTGRSTPSTSTGTPSHHFYMDSGAFCHSTGDKSVLQPYPDNLNVRKPISSIGGVVNGASIPVDGCGYVNRDEVLQLDGVLHTPGSSANLVSVGQLAKEYDVRVIFEKDFFRVESLQQNGVTIGQGHREKDSNLYVLDYFRPGVLFVDSPTSTGFSVLFGNVKIPQQPS